MSFLPSLPNDDEHVFLPARRQELIPRQRYVNEQAPSLSKVLIPYESSQYLGLLPETAANFARLLQQESPFIIAPAGSLQKPKVNAQLAILLNNLNNINAWEDMLIQLGSLPGQGGKIAGLYLVDRHNRRYLVIDVELDPGATTGKLVLQPLGRKARGGAMRLDPEELIDFSSDPHLPFALPVLLYRSRGNRRRRNPDERLRSLQRASHDDPSKLNQLAHARFRAGTSPFSDMEEFFFHVNYTPHDALQPQKFLTSFYKEPWFIATLNSLFTEVARKAATNQYWEESTIQKVTVSITEDHNTYELAVKINFIAPSKDEAEERETIFEYEFMDWADERRRDYNVEIEFDTWDTELDCEADEGQFDDRLQELFYEEELDEDDIEDMDGPDVPQSCKIELTQRLGLHHIFALFEHSGIEVSPLPTIECPKCLTPQGSGPRRRGTGEIYDLGGRRHPCKYCMSEGVLKVNSNRPGYTTGDDWAVQF